jgi:hypothetical protein
MDTFESLLQDIVAMSPPTCRVLSTSLDTSTHQGWCTSSFEEYRHFQSLQSDAAHEVQGRYSISAGREHHLHGKAAVRSVLGKPSETVRMDGDKIDIWNLEVDHPRFSSDVHFQIVHRGAMQVVLLLPNDPVKKSALVGHTTRAHPMAMVKMQALWLQNSLHRSMGGKFWVDWPAADWIFQKR